MQTGTRVKNFSKRRHCGTSRVSRDSHTVARLSVYAESWSFITPTRWSWTFLTSGGLVMSKLGFRFAFYLFHMRNHRFTNKICRTFQTGGEKSNNRKRAKFKLISENASNVCSNLNRLYLICFMLMQLQSKEEKLCVTMEQALAQGPLWWGTVSIPKLSTDWSSGGFLSDSQSLYKPLNLMDLKPTPTLVPVKPLLSIDAGNLLRGWIRTIGKD